MIQAQYIADTNKYIPREHYIRIRKYLDMPDRCLCDILLATGYRVDDVLSSSNGWWDADPERILIIESKTGKIRSIIKTPEIKQLIADYRASIGLTDWHMFDFLCPSRRGGRFKDAHYNRSTLYRHFAKACKKAHLDGKGYTIHSLRKCYAVELYRETQSILEVQRSLNHDRITTTLIYLMDCLGVKL